MRYNDWETRLSRYLLAARSRPFSYGKHDCCLFAAGAVFAITGVDIAEGFRGKYSSRAEAVKLIRQEAKSLRGLLASISKEYGLAEVPVSQAQRGDIVLLRRPSDYSLGIIGLDGRVIAASKVGYTYTKLEPLKAYHV